MMSDGHLVALRCSIIVLSLSLAPSLSLWPECCSKVRGREGAEAVGDNEVGAGQHAGGLQLEGATLISAGRMGEDVFRACEGLLQSGKVSMSRVIKKWQRENGLNKNGQSIERINWIN